eukprot:gene5933-33508_t
MSTNVTAKDIDDFCIVEHDTAPQYQPAELEMMPAGSTTAVPMDQLTQGVGPDTLALAKIEEDMKNEEDLEVADAGAVETPAIENAAALHANGAAAEEHAEMLRNRMEQMILNLADVQKRAEKPDLPAKRVEALKLKAEGISGRMEIVKKNLAVAEAKAASGMREVADVGPAAIGQGAPAMRQAAPEEQAEKLRNRIGKMMLNLAGVQKRAQKPDLPAKRVEALNLKAEGISKRMEIVKKNLAVAEAKSAAAVGQDAATSGPSAGGCSGMGPGAGGCGGRGMRAMSGGGMCPGAGGKCPGAGGRCGRGMCADGHDQVQKIRNRIEHMTLRLADIQQRAQKPDLPSVRMEALNLEAEGISERMEVAKKNLGVAEAKAAGAVMEEGGGLMQGDGLGQVQKIRNRMEQMTLRLADVQKRAQKPDLPAERVEALNLMAEGISERIEIVKKNLAIAEAKAAGAGAAMEQGIGMRQGDGQGQVQKIRNRMEQMMHRLADVQKRAQKPDLPAKRVEALNLMAEGISRRMEVAKKNLAVAEAKAAGDDAAMEEDVGVRQGDGQGQVQRIRNRMEQMTLRLADVQKRAQKPDLPAERVEALNLVAEGISERIENVKKNLAVVEAKAAGANEAGPAANGTGVGVGGHGGCGMCSMGAGDMGPGKGPMGHGEAGRAGNNMLGLGLGGAGKGAMDPDERRAMRSERAQKLRARMEEMMVRVADVQQRAQKPNLPVKRVEALTVKAERISERIEVIYDRVAKLVQPLPVAGRKAVKPAHGKGRNMDASSGSDTVMVSKDYARLDDSLTDVMSDSSGPEADTPIKPDHTVEPADADMVDSYVMLPARRPVAAHHKAALAKAMKEAGEKAAEAADRRQAKRAMAQAIREAKIAKLAPAQVQKLRIRMEQMTLHLADFQKRAQKPELPAKCVETLNQKAEGISERMEVVKKNLAEASGAMREVTCMGPAAMGQIAAATRQAAAEEHAQKLRNRMEQMMLNLADVQKLAQKPDLPAKRVETLNQKAEGISERMEVVKKNLAVAVAEASGAMGEVTCMGPAAMGQIAAAMRQAAAEEHAQKLRNRLEQMMLNLADVQKLAQKPDLPAKRVETLNRKAEGISERMEVVKMNLALAEAEAADAGAMEQGVGMMQGDGLCQILKLRNSMEQMTLTLADMQKPAERVGALNQEADRIGERVQVVQQKVAVAKAKAPSAGAVRQGGAMEPCVGMRQGDGLCQVLNIRNRMEQMTLRLAGIQKRVQKPARRVEALNQKAKGICERIEIAKKNLAVAEAKAAGAQGCGAGRRPGSAPGAGAA